MIQFLRKTVDRVTMYRLMLYFLLVLWFIAMLLTIVHVLPYNVIDILLSGIYLIVACNLINYFFPKIIGARTNLESASITALILTLIISPFAFFENIFTLTFVAIIAMASKYIFAKNKRHIFNPTAIAVFLSALLVNHGASWWIANVYTLPFIILGGLLIIMKIKRIVLVISFLIIYFLTIILFSGSLSINSFIVPSIWFFVFVMLVEPLTSPSIKRNQIIFGGFIAIVYFLFSRIIPNYAYGLETSLLVGNLYSFISSPSFNIVLIFKKKEKVAKNTWRFFFEPMSKFKFTPGQYLEWTYPHKNPDSRGVRRYFTISSAPDNKYVALTTRIATDKGSSFKSAILNIKHGEKIIASSPKGDFVLPKDKNIPLVFIAGGIGITPYMSMSQWMIDKKEHRNIILLYANLNENNIAFKTELENAKQFGLKTEYIITEKDGYIDENMIQNKVPNWEERLFYVSGSEPMVQGVSKALNKMGVRKIQRDFFPGYS